MLRILLLSVLMSSTCALPHGGGSVNTRGHDGVKDGVQERGLFGDDEKQNCTGQSQLTQELAKGGLWGQPRDPRVNYINSHNDDDQDSPFWTAYNNTVASIEIDLWLYEDGKGINTSGCAPEEIPADQTLLIGHDLNDLDPRRTFKKVYLDPIMSILNETTSRPKPQGQHGWNGIFTDKGAPGETLLLTIDLKENTDKIWEALVKEFQPLFDAGLLTLFRRKEGATDLTDGYVDIKPLTVIGSGNTPYGKVIPMNPRFIFKDGPLMSIDEPIPNITNSVWNGNSDDTTPIYWHNSISPTASDSIDKVLTVGIAESLKTGYRTAAGLAHNMGIQTRWWGIGTAQLFEAAFHHQKEIGGTG